MVEVARAGGDPRSPYLEDHLAESAELREELERWRSLSRCANRVFSEPSVPPALAKSIRKEINRARATRARRPLRLFGSITAIAAALNRLFFSLLGVEMLMLRVKLCVATAPDAAAGIGKAPRAAPEAPPPPRAPLLVPLVVVTAWL